MFPAHRNAVSSSMRLCCNLTKRCVLLRDYHSWCSLSSLYPVSFRDRPGPSTMKALRETTSTTTKTSIQAPAPAVSVLGLVHARLRTHALILLNATAAGFQSLDPPRPTLPLLLLFQEIWLLCSPRRPCTHWPTSQRHILGPRQLLFFFFCRKIY